MYRYFVTDREKAAIRRCFSLYLSPGVVNRLPASDTPPTLGGERREVTILVIDIVGYTALSENMSPESVVDLVNRYMRNAADAVERHHGFVDKFMGDGMLAVFGAPLADPDHAAHVVAAATMAKRGHITDEDRALFRRAAGGVRRIEDDGSPPVRTRRTPRVRRYRLRSACSDPVVQARAAESRSVQK